MIDGVPPDRLAEAQTRFASQLYVTPTTDTDALILNTRTAPFTDIRVRQAINYAVDRGKIAALLGQDSQPACQILPVGLPGYRRYCPYTTDPDPAGIWHAPNLAKAEHLIDASHTRGTPITIWNLDEQDLAPADHYLVSLLDRLGYPTRIKNFSDSDPTGPPRVADSRTGVQAALYYIPIGALLFPSAAQVLQNNFACQSFVPHSIGNSNWSEFCDHRLDSQIDNALDAESNNAPNTAALWAQADQHRNQSGASRAADHGHRYPPRLRPRRQLPVQLRAGGAPRPALGALAASPHPQPQTSQPRFTSAPSGTSDSASVRRRLPIAPLGCGKRPLEFSRIGRPAGATPRGSQAAPSHIWMRERHADFPAWRG